MSYQIPFVNNVKTGDNEGKLLTLYRQNNNFEIVHNVIH
jgi:hypothetical protein